MRAFRDLLALRDLRRLVVAWTVAQTAGYLSTVALLVYAYNASGAALIAAYGVLRAVAGIVVTPVLMAVTVRRGEARVLTVVTAGRGLLLGGAGIGVATGVTPSIVVGLAVVSASMSATFRPTQATVLPLLCRTAHELAAANVTASVADNAAALVGPVLGGLLIGVADTQTGLGVAAVLLMLAAVTVRGLGVPRARHHRVTRRGLRRSARETVTGAVALTRIARPAGLAVLAVAQTFARGAMLVLIVVLALDDLRLPDGSVGYLNAAVGMGGIAGGVVAAGLVRLSRLGRCFTAGVALWGISIVVLAAAPSGLLAFIAIGLVGVANAVEDASVFTLLPRLISPALSAPALGALEILVLLGTGLGSLTSPVLLDHFSVRESLAGVGVALVVLSLAYSRTFVRIDADIVVPDPDVDVLRSLPIFAPLALVIIEELASELERHRFAAGEVVVAEGEYGDRFHVIVEGTARVTVGSEHRRDLHPGDGFGEIALLRDVPRTATITRPGPLQTHAVSRDVFLASVTGNRTSLIRTRDLVDARLASDPVDRSDGLR